MQELRVNVAQLLQETIGAVREFELAALLPVHDCIEVGTVLGGLKLTRTDRGILATGGLKISVSDTCSRCLRPIDYWVNVRVDDEFLPSVDIGTGRKLRYEGEAEADTNSIDQHHDLDLTQTLGEYRTAALPLAPLCQADCKGICSQCGVDLNETTHSCEAAIDPRWEKLRELLR